MDPSNPNSTNLHPAEPHPPTIPAPLQPVYPVAAPLEAAAPPSTLTPSPQLNATPYVNPNPSTSSNVLPIPHPLLKPYHNVPWKLTIGSVIVLVVVGVIGLITPEVSMAKFIAQALLFLGLFVAGICGYSVAQLVSNSINAKNSGLTTKKSPLMTVGIVLCAFSILLGLITLIPGIILIIMASRAPAAASPNTQLVKPMNNAGKIALVVLSFFGGFIPAALLGIVLAFMVSVHACQLTSSKCM